MHQDALTSKELRANAEVRKSNMAASDFFLFFIYFFKCLFTFERDSMPASWARAERGEWGDRGQAGSAMTAESPAQGSNSQTARSTT